MKEWAILVIMHKNGFFALFFMIFCLFSVFFFEQIPDLLNDTGGKFHDLVHRSNGTLIDR